MKSIFVLLLFTILGNGVLASDFGKYTYKGSEGSGNWTLRRRTRTLDARQRPPGRNRVELRLPWTRNSHIPPVVAPEEDEYSPIFNCFIVDNANQVGICACVIVGVNFILTTNRCVFNFMLRDFQSKTRYTAEEIFVRIYSWEDDSQSQLDIKVMDLMSHKNFAQWEYNIAALYMAHKIVPNEYLGLARLPKRDTLYQPQIRNYWTLSNLRYFHDGPVDFEDSMWMVKTGYVHPNTCKQLMASGIVFNELKVTCASYYHEGSADKNCLSDHGTGLSVDGTLIGLLGHTPSCGSPSSATMFTNIGLNLKWINRALETFEKRYADENISEAE